MFFSFPIISDQPSDYTWVLQQLKTMYLDLELPDPTVIVTDMERGLMAAIPFKFPTANHILCLWHINNNVIADCEKSFSKIQETC